MLTLEWRGGSVLMTGPAMSVFTGEIDLDTAFPEPALRPSSSDAMLASPSAG